jgi:glycosyltransferase involved in cell wall biosynthesis
VRIAVYHDLPSGGAKRTLYETARRLCARGHTLDEYTLTTSDGEFCDLRPHVSVQRRVPFLASGLFRSPLGRLNSWMRWRDLQRLDRLAREIAAEIDSGGYDAVFAQPCMWTQAPLVLRYLRTPSVYYCHEAPRHLYDRLGQDSAPQGIRGWLDGVDPFLRIYRTTARRVDQTAARRATVVLVNSAYVNQQVEELYGFPSTISYHGVDTDVFCPVPESSRTEFVLTVGAVQPHKGFDFLIDCFRHMDARVRPQLRVIGNMQNAGYREALQARARESGVDLRIDVGVSGEELVRQYQEASLVAYAPYGEPFGLVPLEAMACGKAVVGIGEGGVRETVVDGETGLLVDRDAAAFGAAIQSLLENPSQRKRYGQNGRRHVLEHWSWDAAVARVEQHLLSAAQIRE